MKKFKLWILPLLFSVVGLSVVLSGCFLLGPGFQNVTSGAVINGTISGITNNATVTIRDDLGENTTASSNSHYYYRLSVKPGVRTITYSCTGYATVVKKYSILGHSQPTINITMKRK